METDWIPTPIVGGDWFSGAIGAWAGGVVTAGERDGNLRRGYREDLCIVERAPKQASACESGGKPPHP
jgi:hypothetical protein